MPPRPWSRRFTTQVGRSVLLAALVLSLLPAAPAAADGESRTFGSQPLDDVLAQATKHASCGVNRDQLAAMVLAMTFPESGADPDESPSPMTMSRWDTNAALYAFGDKNTPYKTAFWHPGIGPWQWDDISGIGLSAAQRMNTAIAAAATTETVIKRYCTKIAEGKTRAEARDHAWGPWVACWSGLCESIYNDLVSGSNLVNLIRDRSTTRHGGVLARTCEILGQDGTFPCSYVDPARAQGSTDWSIPGFGPSPLTAPFYSYVRGSDEHRTWLGADTGHRIDINASKRLSANSRAGLSWTSNIALCDRTTGRGVCDPVPPKGTGYAVLTVNGHYEPIVGDWNGDGYDEPLWYGPGTGADNLWLSKGNGTFVNGWSVRVDRDAQPLVGDFDGNGRDDILWYVAGPVTEVIWWGGNPATSTATSITNGYQPLVGDFDGNGTSDIIWYAAGPSPDYVWFGLTNRTFDNRQIHLNGTYTPLIGDFDGDGRTDVFWYAPGPAADSVWWGHAGRGFAATALTVNGTYIPLIGDYNGDGRDDIFWYAPGPGADSVWFGLASRTFGPRATNVNGTYLPVIADFDGPDAPGGDDIVWYAAGTGADSLWRSDRNGNFAPEPVRLDGTYQPYVGNFADTAADDVIWYGPGPGRDAMWLG